MRSVDVPAAPTGTPPWANPWPYLAVGLAAVTVVLLAPALLPGLRLGLLALGLLASAEGVVLRPRSALALGLAALTAALATRGLDWDTGRLVLAVFTAIAAAAAVLVILPRAVSRAVVSLLIVLHFVGILTAVTSVPPPGGSAPWLTNQLWTRFYRPYLQFMVLNNAYHFYSPEPGPACLLWFHLTYADGSDRWVQVPNRAETRDPLALDYYRRLPITESVNQLAAVPAVPFETARRRVLAGAFDGIPSPDEIALHLPGVPQYRVPIDNAVRLLQSYARFAARAHSHADPGVAVTGVKVYRVVHGIIPPGDFARGREPTDPTLYLPYFQGEFDGDGTLKDPTDPYLYWLIPILRSKHGVLDSVELHAGSTPLGESE
jgi:hypothetical protein